jgi:hypothetical protein
VSDLNFEEQKLFQISVIVDCLATSCARFARFSSVGSGVYCPEMVDVAADFKGLLQEELRCVTASGIE